MNCSDAAIWKVGTASVQDLVERYANNPNQLTLRLVRPG
jgi:hypothetical protein